MFGGFKKSRTFATAIERESDKKLKGALVQLVRIHACHAWGHGFESRTHRNNNPNPLKVNHFQGIFFFFGVQSGDQSNGST